MTGQAMKWVTGITGCYGAATVPLQLLSSQGKTQFCMPLHTREVLMHMLLWQKKALPAQGAVKQTQHRYFIYARRHTTTKNQYETKGKLCFLFFNRDPVFEWSACWIPAAYTAFLFLDSAFFKERRWGRATMAEAENEHNTLWFIDFWFLWDLIFLLHCIYLTVFSYYFAELDFTCKTQHTIITHWHWYDLNNPTV